MRTTYAPLTDEQRALLESAPHRLAPHSNVAPGTPGGDIMVLAKQGLLVPVERFEHPDVFQCWTEYARPAA